MGCRKGCLGFLLVGIPWARSVFPPGIRQVGQAVISVYCESSRLGGQDGWSAWRLFLSWVVSVLGRLVFGD